MISVKLARRIGNAYCELMEIMLQRGNKLHCKRLINFVLKNDSRTVIKNLIVVSH